jgi:tRNA dimethylallyltransferase
MLERRIARRVDQMFAEGLIDEVQALVASPGGLSRTAAQALGYKELLAVIDGSITCEQARADIVLRTRQYAIRQLRWFQRDPRIRWVDIEHDPVDEVMPVISQLCDT